MFGLRVTMNAGVWMERKDKKEILGHDIRVALIPR